MSDSIEELKNIVNKEEEPAEVKRQKWSGFVESTVLRTCIHRRQKICYTI